MRERQSPQTKIGSCVRNGTQNILDGVDALVDPNFGHFFFFLLLFFVLMMPHWDSGAGSVR